MNRINSVGMAIGAGTLAASTLLLIILIAIPGRDRCETVDHLSHDDRENAQNIATPDFRNLANFIGALHVKDKTGKTEDRYLPIRLSSLSVDPESTTFNMESNCSNLVLIVKQMPSSTWYVDALEVEADLGEGRRKVCTVLAPFWPPLTEYDYFSCYQEISHNCFDLSTQTSSMGDTSRVEKSRNFIYTLDIFQVAYELDGDREKIHAGHFSKNPVYCKDSS